MILDILYGGWLSAPNGASSVVKSLKDNAPIFKASNLEPVFWSLDNYRPRSFDYVPNERNWKLGQLKDFMRKSIHNFVVRLSKKNVVFAKIIIKRNMSFSQEVANYYLNNSRNSNSKILVHDLFTCYYYLKNREQRRPTFLVLHNNGDTFSMHLEYHPCLKGSNFLEELREIEKYVLNNVDGVIFVAENPKLNFLRLHPDFDEKKVHFIHNGIADKHINKTSEQRDKIELVCVGSVSTRKGQDIIVDALMRLSEREREKIHITIIGDGALKPHLEEITHENSLPITFVGFSKNVDNYLAQSDIFLLTSRDEGFPISILEAERAALPVISTKVAGIPEMVENCVSGILIEPSATALANILKNISSYDWGKMGLLSRLNYQNKFTIKQMITNYINLLNETN